MIEVKNVTKTYGKKNDFTALDDVSLDIKRGASVAILGKSGSGKSTLMHVMSGLDRATKGEILINGKNIQKLKQHEIDAFRASTIGFIFQSFFIEANETVYNNVALPLEITKASASERRERVLDALKAVELDDKVSNAAGNLSGGQKQRLAIARAIVNKPEILFADEPTGNLDSVTGQTIEDLLFSYNKEENVTLIIVTHDPDLAAKCDTIVTIKDGQIGEITHKNKKNVKEAK